MVNDELAADLEIENKDHVRITSLNGGSAVFEVHVTENQPYEQIYAPIHYIETNLLTPSIYDPFSKEPSYKTTPVSMIKI